MPQDWDKFERYVKAGRTPVRFENEGHEHLGIVMSSRPYPDEDSESMGFYYTERLVVAWYDGVVGPFTARLLDFDIDGEWCGIDDILMFWEGVIS